MNEMTTKNDKTKTLSGFTELRAMQKLARQQRASEFFQIQRDLATVETEAQRHMTVAISVADLAKRLRNLYHKMSCDKGWKRDAGKAEHDRYMASVQAHQK